jgi:hypothetical protein
MVFFKVLTVTLKGTFTRMTLVVILMTIVFVLILILIGSKLRPYFATKLADRPALRSVLLIFVMIFSLGVLYVGAKNLKNSNGSKKNLDTIAKLPPLSKYWPETRDFSVSFPGKPNITSSTVKTQFGEVEAITYQVSSSGNFSFTVIQMNYSVPLDPMRGFQEFYSEMKKKAGESFLINDQKSMDISGYPAHQITLTDAGAKVRTLLIIAGARQFQLSVAGAEQIVNSQTTEDFFSSFHLPTLDQ